MTKLKNIDKERSWGMSLGPPPRGIHDMKVTEVEQGNTVAGDDKWTLTLEVVGGPHAGSTFREFLPVMPKTYGRVKGLLEAAGIEIEGGDWDFDPQALVGALVAVAVDFEEDREGAKNDDGTVKMWPRARGFGPPRGESEVPPDTTGLGSNGASKADDEIPF